MTAAEKITTYRETLGGRRFILCLGCGVASTALLIGGYITETTWRDVVMGTVGAYIIGNVWQKREELRAPGSHP